MKIQVKKDGKISALIIDVAKIEMVEDVELIPAKSQDAPFEKKMIRFKVYSGSNCLLFEKLYFHQDDADALLAQIAEDKGDVISINE